MKYLKTFEIFSVDVNVGVDNNTNLNPALKKQVEDHVNMLIEKDYNKLLKMLNIKTPGRKIDVDELRKKAIEYFLEAPDRMRNLNLPLKSLSIQTNVVPKTNNIGGCLSGRL